MASYKNFQNQRKRASKGVNLFEQGRSFKKPKSKEERFYEGVAIWTGFYRSNPHRFVKDYLGVTLKVFQVILLYAMMHFNYVVYIASRGQGKTWLTALYAVVRAILYPETKIIVAAGQKGQALEVILKIQEFMENAPLLQREISKINTNVGDPLVLFHNGSWIRVVAANDGARGKRSNLLIVDEYRLVPTDIIETVLKKFQSAPRTPAFLDIPEYKKDFEKHIERNKQIYLSSAWYQEDPSWKRIVSYTKNLINGRSYFVCQLPYQLALSEGLLSREQIEDDMSESTFNPIKWEMEMGAMFWGSRENSFFVFEEIIKSRKLEKVYYPREVIERVGDKNLNIPRKQKDEFRTISADIAIASGSNNDASIYTVARTYRTKGQYRTEIIYMEDWEGVVTGRQAMRIKQLYHHFECDYIVLDTRNAGISVYDSLIEYTTDLDTGEEYPPFKSMNNEDLANRCVYNDAKKNIFAINATNVINSTAALRTKESLRTGKLLLPAIEDYVYDYLRKIKGFIDMSEELRMLLTKPFIQTTLLQTEMLNLIDETKSDGYIKLKEPRSGRKDRYSSVSYLVYFVGELEIKERKDGRQKVNNPLDSFFVRPAKLL